MKPIEKLTDAERGWLMSDPEFAKFDVRRKVLRIIDQLTAALEAAEQRVLLQADAPELVRSHEALQARVAELESVREATLAPEGHGGYLDLVKRARAAEAELADLRGRVERAGALLTHALVVDLEPQDALGRVARALEALRGR